MTLYLQTYPYRRMARRWVENRDQTLGVNIQDEDEAYVLSALVPGLKSDELTIQILDDVVRIEGEYKRSSPVDQRSTTVPRAFGGSPTDKADENNYLVRELPSGSFTRTLRLPAAIDAQHVEADLTDGVLTLTLPKAESARPKQIRIKSG